MQCVAVQLLPTGCELELLLRQWVYSGMCGGLTGLGRWFGCFYWPGLCFKGSYGVMNCSVIFIVWLAQELGLY